MASEEKSEVSPIAAPIHASSGGGGKLITAIAAINLLLTCGVAGILLISFTQGTKQASIEDISTHPEVTEEGGDAKGEGKGGHGDKTEAKRSADYGRMVQLEQFTINLSTPGSIAPKYVRVNIALEVPNEDAESEVTQKMPQIRNVVIDLFNSKRPADLANAEGRDYLKEEIKNALNGFMVSGKVRGVYFMNFAVAG